VVTSWTWCAPPTCCRLIETTSSVGLPLSSAQQACLYAHLLDNLRHASPDIQQAAAAALGAYFSRYLPSATPEALQQSTAQFLGDLRDAAGSPPARRGAALALGALPRSGLGAAIEQWVVSGQGLGWLLVFFGGCWQSLYTCAHAHAWPTVCGCAYTHLAAHTHHASKCTGALQFPGLKAQLLAPTSLRTPAPSPANPRRLAGWHAGGSCSP
jgi:hypothetical protein